MRNGGAAGLGDDNARSAEQEKARNKVLQSIRDFRMRPRDVKAYLDRFVVEQDDAKKVLAVALCDHYNWARRCMENLALREANYSKPNILILGPTGSGKTYLVRTLAKMLGVPFVKADATKFSETGIVGEDAEDVVRGLVENAGGDVELAQYGIVYIDEVDKITASSSGRSTGGWSGRQVQSNFLKIMEDTEISLKSQLQASIGNVFGNLGGGGQDGNSTISTKFILFIFSGAFNGLNDRIRDRVGKKNIGFLVEDGDQLGSGKEGVPSQGAAPAPSYLHLAETSDFVEAGLEPEFVGRVPVRVAIRALDANDLFSILTKAEDSVLKQYEKEFDGYGIALKSEEAGLRQVAELAVEEKTGARALVTVLERIFRDFKFELPSTSCTEVALSAQLVKDPAAALRTMLSSPEQAAADLQRWLEDLERSTSLRISLDEAVREKVLEECTSTSQSAEAVLNQRLRSTGVVGGFQEIHQATQGQVELFNVTPDMYERPEEEIAKWKRSLETLR